MLAHSSYHQCPLLYLEIHSGIAKSFIAISSEPLRCGPEIWDSNGLRCTSNDLRQNSGIVVYFQVWACVTLRGNEILPNIVCTVIAVNDHLIGPLVAVHFLTSTLRLQEKMRRYYRQVL